MQLVVRTLARLIYDTDFRLLDTRILRAQIPHTSRVRNRAITKSVSRCANAATSKVFTMRRGEFASPRAWRRVKAHTVQGHAGQHTSCSAMEPPELRPTEQGAEDRRVAAGCSAAATPRHRAELGPSDAVTHADPSKTQRRHSNGAIHQRNETNRNERLSDLPDKLCEQKTQHQCTKLQIDAREERGAVTWHGDRPRRVWGGGGFPNIRSANSQPGISDQRCLIPATCKVPDCRAKDADASTAARGIAR